MVFNRLCDPESKLGILRWLEGSLVPEVAAEAVTHQHLLRTMDTLDACVEQMESALSGLLRPLIDRNCPSSSSTSPLSVRKGARNRRVRYAGSACPRRAALLAR
jgi:hypothetical protein